MSTITLSADNGISVPLKTTAQKNAILNPSIGTTVYDTDLGMLSVYNGTNWTVSSGATGGGTDNAFYVNGTVINTAYTVPTNKNAMSAGPITLNAAVTVNTGSRWTVV